MEEALPVITVASTVVSGLATVVIAILSLALWRSSKRVEWLTGALETHSDIQLAIAAKRAEIELIWWDPTVELVPSVRKHGEQRDLSRIYTYLPPSERTGTRKIKRAAKTRAF